MTKLTKTQLVEELEVLRRTVSRQNVEIAALHDTVRERDAQIANITSVASAVNTMHRADPAWAARVAQRKAVMEAARAQAMNSNHMVVV